MNKPAGSKRVLQPVTVADAATAHLRERLFSGDYEPGEKIKDTAVAEELDIARPTARIAVQQLIVEGLLQRDPGYSARVRDFTADEVRDLFRVRTLIEVESVRAVKNSRASVKGVGEALEGFRGLGARKEWAKISEADAAFHQAVVDAGESPRLSAYFAAITNEMRLLIAFAGEHYGKGDSPFAEHEELYETLAEHVPVEVSEQQWLFHLDQACKFHLGKLQRL